jgi:hypothetical protein
LLVYVAWVLEMTYCVQHRKVLYLLFAALELGIELRNNLVGQHV